MARFFWLKKDYFVVIRSFTAGFISIVMSLYSSNRPRLCICRAKGPVTPGGGNFKIDDFDRLAANRLGGGHASRSVPGIDQDLDSGPLVIIELRVR